MEYVKESRTGGVRVDHAKEIAATEAIKSNEAETQVTQIYDPTYRSPISNLQRSNLGFAPAMASAGSGKENGGDGGRGRRDDAPMQPKKWTREQFEAAMRAVGFGTTAAMASTHGATSRGGGDNGGSGEDPSRPKPIDGAPEVPLLCGRQSSDRLSQEADDGNWDDGNDADDEPGFRQGPETHLGCSVDMGDEAFVEFDEEKEEPAMEQKIPGTWTLLARYMRSEERRVGKECRL